MRRQSFAYYLDGTECHDYDAEGLVCARRKPIHFKGDHNNSRDCQQRRNDLKGDGHCSQHCVVVIMLARRAQAPPTHLHGTMQLEPDRSKLFEVASGV